ncbi:hypothetical protein C3L33_22122, partial [Rhododendron williamsianum]
MGFPSFLAFFLVSHLLVLHSTGSCPSSFDCGTLGPIEFPFTNSTHSLCGLYTVSCDEAVPKVTLGAEGRSYQVTGFSSTGNTIKINDPLLRTLIEYKSCNFSSYINPLNTLSVSFTVSPNLTIFKCLASSPELENQTDNYFVGDYIYYRGCRGYTVYYSYPNQQVDRVPASESIPPNCVFFQLPVVSSVEDRNLSDPFSLLTSGFSVGYHVSEECQACLAGGGRCSRDTREFRCLKDKGGTGISIYKRI